MRRLVPAAALAAFLVSAAPAHATLVYVKNLTSQKLTPSIWAAGNDGSAAKRVTAGTNPKITPDGKTVVFATISPKSRYVVSLAEVPVGGGTPRKLINNLLDTYDVELSADSTHALAIAGRETGPSTLYSINLADGTHTTVAKGFFYGASYSPDGTQVVYAYAASETYGVKSDLYIAPAAGGTPRRLTKDGASIYPLWGPQTIAFTHQVPRKNYAPQFNVFTVNPDGSGRKQITHDKVGKLVSGLVPTQFSADGSRLLTEFGGQDTSYAVALTPATGKETSFVSRTLNVTGNAISRDGSTILGNDGGPDPVEVGNVVTVPFAGGPKTIVVKNAAQPDWNR